MYVLHILGQCHLLLVRSRSVILFKYTGLVSITMQTKIMAINKFFFPHNSSFTKTRELILFNHGWRIVSLNLKF